MAEPRRRNSITYGSLAYDLDTLVRERQLEEAAEIPERRPEPERQVQTQPHRQAQVRTRPSLLTLCSVVTVCAMVMVLLLGYVQLTTVSNHVSGIKSELATLEEEHVSLLAEYEKTFDLATIKAAAEEAGMSKPTSGQIQYIDLSGSDAAVVYGDEPGVVSKAATSLKDGAMSVWEYFR